MKQLLSELLVVVTVTLFITANSSQMNHENYNSEISSKFISSPEEADKIDSKSWPSVSPPKSDNEPTKTFERVVLEGSNIIISCPNSATISPVENSFAKVQQNGRVSREKQFAFVNQQQPRRQQQSAQPSQPVKWFRNHVPLVNLNYFQRAQLDSSVDEAQTMPTAYITESNRTTELLQTKSTTTTTTTVYNTGAATATVSTSNDNQRWLTSLERNPSPVSDVFELGDFLTSENNNELGRSGARKLTNMPPGGREGERAVEALLADTREQEDDKLKEDGEEEGKDPEKTSWYINKFGELVINRVSQYFSGKYTCLTGSKQSEVLVDVLVDSYPIERRNREQAFKIEEKLEQPSSLRSNPSSKNNNLESMTEFVYHETGNGPIEKRKNPELETSTRFFASNSLLDKFDRQNEQQEQKLKDNSLVDDNTSLRAKSFKTFQGDSEVGQPTGYVVKLPSIRNGNEINRKEAELSGKDVEKSLLRDIDDRLLEDKAMKLEDLKLHYHTQQRHPIHVVKSEAIQINDLKFVPGFLYTKQQLYCPIPDQSAAHLLSFTRSLCSTNHPRKATSKSHFESSEKLKCLRIAGSLIQRIVRASSSLEGQTSVSDCPLLVSELIWFKDGKQLKFDASGKETSTDLNIKLINFFDQFDFDASTDSSSSSNEGRNRFYSSSFSSSPSFSSSNSKSRNSQSSERMCSITKGRVLEIDGLRKESSGRYTCAFRLDVSKMNRIILALRGLNKLNQLLKWAASAGGYDISSGEELHSPEEIESSSREKYLPLPLAQIERNKTIEIGSAQVSVVTSSQEEEFVSEEETPSPEDNEVEFTSSLTKQNSILKSILEGKVSSEQSLSYIKQSLSRFQNPITTIQTFSLAVVEHPANSCVLWSTITEAGNAYTRRKLADFKRLKRNLDDEHKATMMNSPAPKLKVYSPTSRKGGSRSSAHLSAELWPTRADHLPKGTIFSPYANHRNSNNKIESQTEAYSLTETRREYERGAFDRELMDEKAGKAYEAELGIRYEGPLNVWHLTPDNNDSRTVLLSQREEDSSSSLLNNADELNESDAEVSTSQTKILMRHHENVKHFNYANERNFKPIYTTDGDDERTYPIRKLTEQQQQNGRFKRASAVISKAKRSFSAQEEETDLITQRGYKRFDTACLKHVGSLKKKRQTSSVENEQNSVVINDSTNFEAASIIDDSITARDSEWNNRRSDKVLEQEKEVTDINLDKPTGKTSERVVELVASEHDSEAPWHTTENINGLNWSVEVGEESQAESRLGSSLLEDKSPPFEAAKYRQYDQLNSQLNSFPTQSNEELDYNIKYPIKKELESIDQSKLSNGRRSESEKFTAYTNTDTRQKFNDAPSIANKKKSPPSFVSRGIESMPTAEDNLDESLMWTAGQYLYMHMKALAASSMFGVEVSVEWSNERANGTNIDSSDRLNKEKHSQEDNSRFAKLRDAAPFATIDVISGQNLQLQCTAQALGRLPEVKWYKRVHTIPAQLRSLMKLARRIEHDLYWPLSELYLLDKYDKPKKQTSFVCSRTNAIFDNLANQTFTVISSLHLSQYNDVTSAGAIKSGSLLEGNYNLYACIVDADVRRNYATLGVNFRRPPSKISLEISKRLQARSAFTKSTDLPDRTSSPPVEEAIKEEKNAQYDLFQQNLLRFPMKSYWVPIQNNSTVKKHIVSDGTFPITPAVLSAIIVLVFSSSIALIYLTVRTYRSLTNPLMDDNLNDSLNDSSIGMTIGREVVRCTVTRPQTTLIGRFNPEGNHNSCLCRYENELNSLSLDTISEYPHMYPINQSSRNIENYQQQELANNLGQSLYEAHSHPVGLGCSFHKLDTSLIAELPSDPAKSNYSYWCNHKVYK